MGRSFNYARSAKTVPTIQSIEYKSGATFKKLALVIDDTNGQVDECGADPASVLGVALEGVATKLGFGEPYASQTVFATGREAEVSVCIADRLTEFSARGVNGGTDPVAPLQTNIGEQYGVAKVNDDWVIDLAEITAKVVEITDIVLEADGTGFFICKFLESVLSRP